MNTLIHADIFFFVTTIVVILVALGVIIALYYVIRILRTVSQVSETVKNESEEIVKDVHALRGEIKKEGVKFMTFGTFFKKIFRRRKNRT